MNLAQTFVECGKRSKDLEKLGIAEVLGSIPVLAYKFGEEFEPIRSDCSRVYKAREASVQVRGTSSE